MSQQDMDLSVVREQIARVLHDAAAGRITPDATPHGRMADEVVEQVLRPLLAPMHAAHYTPYADEEHQGGYCYDFFAPMLARVAQAERLAEKRLAAREDWKARCLAAEESRRDWAAEALRLDERLQETRKELAVTRGKLGEAQGNHWEARDRLAAVEASRMDWAAEAEQLHGALAELVQLKDGPRGADYEARKPLAWEAARRALAAGFALPLCAVHPEADR